MVHGNTTYFSRDNNVYSYTLASDKWTKLPRCENERFGLAIVNNEVTTVGGCAVGSKAVNSLASWYEGSLLGWGAKWRELLPPMPTARVSPATATTPAHLIVAGGWTSPHIGEQLPTVEILDTNTLQWSSTSNLPKAMGYLHMILCGEHLYLSEHSNTFSCSVEELLKSRKPASTNSNDGGSVWTKLEKIPAPYDASLATLRGQVLAIGGSDQFATPTGAIHQYNRNTNSWSVIGEMPTPRARPLVAVLLSNELIAVGGTDGKGKWYNITEIARTEHHTVTAQCRHTEV